MRQAFLRALCDLAAADDRIVLLTGDLGYMAMETFRERFPARFVNVGVAEQNLIGIATGLAEAGLRPYAYSIATFATLRPFEFIRNGPVMHRLPVRIVGMGMGFEYGHAGPTHHAVEDVALMRTLPALTVVIPADGAQAASAVAAGAAVDGPVYYSLGKNERLTVPHLDGRFELGRAQVVREGRDVVILSMGSVCVEACAAAETLASHGVDAAVAVVSSFNPDPADDVADLLSSTPCALTVEAQTVTGGLGAFVSSVIATRGLSCRLRMLGVTTSPDGTSGSQPDRWRKHHLDAASIVGHSLRLLDAGGRQPLSPDPAWL